jgi:hypothetical protein
LELKKNKKWLSPNNSNGRYPEDLSSCDNFKKEVARTYIHSKAKTTRNPFWILKGKYFHSTVKLDSKYNKYRQEQDFPDRCSTGSTMGLWQELAGECHLDP